MSDGRKSLVEVNFDGLVGPTHNYAGLSPGNVASTSHVGQVSNPRAAALQGIEKMRYVAGLGVVQGVLPPHARPDLDFLRGVGFSGSAAEVIGAAAVHDEYLLRVASSASAMWTANAATVGPGPDTEDGRTHLCVANLFAMPHRALEAPTTFAILSRIFDDASAFAVHPALPVPTLLDDEGAANHTRLQTDAGVVHLFGYGRAGPRGDAVTKRYPARQTRAASEGVARRLGLSPDDCLFWPQAPEGIDGGAFHTDVLAVGVEHVFLVHEDAFSDLDALIVALTGRLGPSLHVVRARAADLPLADAVAAYPFNSQLVRTREGLSIIAPEESRGTPAADAFLRHVVDVVPAVEAVHYLDVNESMNNGGGPACLRLRVPLTPAQKDTISARVWLDDTLYRDLKVWVQRHYRDRISAADLADPALHREVCTALDELSTLMGLGAVYPFQR